MEGIADDDAERQLDQCDREADLDRDRAGDENPAAENRCQSKLAHRSSFESAVVSTGRGHQPRRAVRREPHRAWAEC